MSTPTRHAPTRRTVLRAAAWTAPAVSIAVAAPAFATSHVHVPKGSVGSSTPDKYSVGNDKYVRWDLTVTNTGTDPLTTLTVVFSFTDNGSAGARLSSVTGATGTWTWTGLTASWTGSVATNQPVAFRANFIGANNAGGTVVANVFSGSTQIGSSATGTWK